MTTKTSKIIKQRLAEQRQSRIKRTKDLILNKTTAGFLNNHKWYKIFDWLESNHMGFELKTLLLENPESCNQIRELEETSVLIDDNGDFIEFLEIDRLTIKKQGNLISFLDSLQVRYAQKYELIDIDGYEKINS